MNTKSYVLKTICTGLLLLILFSAVLFILRKINMAVFYETIYDYTFRSESRPEIVIQPSGLATEKDKALLEEAKASWSRTYGPSPAPFYSLEGMSSITASIGDGVVYNTLGIVQVGGNIFQKQFLFHRLHSLSLLKNETLWVSQDIKTGTCSIIYRDSNTGFLIHCRIERQPDGEKEKWVKTILACAGTEKAGKTLDSAAGRFSRDLFVKVLPSGQYLLFDKEHPRFYRIDFENLDVVQGPELPMPDYEKRFRFLHHGALHPVIGINLQWWPPIRKTEEGRKGVSLGTYDSPEVIDGKVPYLTASGQVKWLDIQTLQPAGTAGFIPGTALCPFRDLLTCDVQTVVLNDGGYQGLIAGSIPRFPNQIDVNVFDKQGNKIGGETKSIRYGNLPGGPSYLAAEFLLESLHAPVLLLGSFFTSRSIETIEAHQAMLLLPVSFIGQIGFVQDDFIAGLVLALVYMLPALLLAVFLAWRVHRDAVIIGLDRTARRRWFWCTLAFGLVGYLTYRMTRPAEAMVTCENCGRLRRPDREVCHRCGAAWNIPELTPPAWRIYTQKAS